VAAIVEPGLLVQLLIHKKRLATWANKVNEIKVLRAYFNNHYGGNAILNALQFKGTTDKLTEQDTTALKGKSISDRKNSLLKRSLCMFDSVAHEIVLLSLYATTS